MLYAWLIPVVVGVAVLNLGSVVVLKSIARRSRLQKRLHLTTTQPLAATPPMIQKLGLLAVKVSGKVSPAMGEKLAQAGFLHPAAPRIYMGIRVLLLALGVMISLIIVTPLSLTLATKYMIVIGGGCLLFILPGVYMGRCRTRRVSELRHVLPDVIDLLEISTAAGMGLSMAWNTLTEEIRPVSTTMANEMALVNLEIHLGSSQVAALRHMVQRTGVDELSSLVALIVQTEQFGTGIAEALRTFAISMREMRSFNAQERAEKMALKMLFPMVGFLFPATVLVMVGPAFQALSGVLGGGH